jgi:hypothetical protein
MTRKSLFGSVALALCIVCCSPVFAQDLGATRGGLAGTVYDTSKAVVPGAAVTATGPIGSQKTTSNGQGNFTFSGLVPGKYALKVEKEGFKAVLFSNVEILINNTATVNVTLETGAVSTTVEVTSSALSVDTTQSSINSNLDDSFYNNIPVARNVSSLMKMAPGVVAGLGTAGMVTGNSGSSATDSNPSISGASGLENLYVADGVVLNDPSYGGLGGFSTVYGSLGVGITPAFVKEVEVKTAAFEPQYGHSTGGVVQMVTKSGSRQMHGTIGGYFATPGMQAVFANKDDFNPVNKIGRQLTDADYEGDLELGGYIPIGALKNHIFYFGAFNPTGFHDYVSPASTSGLFLVQPNIDRQTDTYAYAGKLTLRATDSTTLESSLFGDPAHTNAVPWSTLAAANTSSNSKWKYGTTNWDTRVETAITSTWTADVAYTRAWNHFNETPENTSLYSILDQTQTAGLPGQAGEFQAQGLPILVNYTSHTQAINFDTSKILHFAGNHTISVGYFWQAPVYDDTTKYSFPTYAIPGTNATGGDPGTDQAVGRMSDASLELQLAPATCTLCPLMNVPGYGTPQPVTLYQVRGRFDGGVSHNTGKYNASYLNDSWELSKYATLNLGLRWEQQRLTGTAARAFFNDQWSPRIGFIVDPTGDRKSKIYVNFARLAFVLPLDMAVRELSSEDDNLNEYWAPPSGANGMVTLNSFGTVNFQPDAAHLLNGAAGGIASPASIEIQSGGEPFTPGIRMEYNDEFVVGAEHQFSGGFFASARYVDRRMKRVVEDEVGESVEQLTALAFNGGSYSYVIGNPNAQQSIFVTPNEITWMPTNPANANANAPAGCFDANGTITPFTSGSMYNTFGVLQGAACFPAVNGKLNTDPAALFGGEYFPNGCAYCHPGLYPNPSRQYQAVEFEVNKSFGNNWELRSNFRVGRLYGNYEGAFRNDNNQSDPGISSLFDLTDGDLGLLGQQLGLGPLNTDRKYVLNVFPSYTIATGFAKNLVLGSAVSIESGVPLTTLAAQQIYGNAGEVPLFGRGNLGFSPVTGTVSAHLEYPIKFGERKQLKFEFDAFNLANTKRSILSTQDVDLSFGVLNQDFNNHVPLTFVAPFSARAGFGFTF